MLATTHDQTSARDTGFWTPIVIVLLYLGTLLYAYFLYAPCDDTYIYLVYVKNQLAGNGLTFNGDKVQGFTSALWTGLIWLLGRFGVALPTAANVLSGVSALLALIATFVLGRRVGLSQSMALLAPLFLMTTGDFAFYAGNGLESVFFTAMLTFSIAFVTIDKPLPLVRSLLVPVVLAVMILARPEGIMMALVIVAAMYWRSRDWRPLLRTIAIVVLILVPIQFALKSYYGYWLPNTYYAKSGAGLSNLGQGTQYVFNFLSWSVLFVVALAYILFFRFDKLGSSRWVLVLLLALWIGRVAIQGGDNMVGYRALLPIVPLLYVMVVKGLDGMSRRAVVFVAVVVSLYHIGVYNFGNIYGSSWNVHVTRQAEQWRLAHVERMELALALKERVEPGGSIAVNAAGVLPYYSELKTIDMLGLNNEYLAHHGDRDRSMAYGHQVGDGEWVLEQKPDVILLGGAGSKKGDRFFGDAVIERSPEFVRNYNATKLPTDATGYFRVKKPGRRKPPARQQNQQRPRTDR